MTGDNTTGGSGNSSSA